MLCSAVSAQQFTYNLFALRSVNLHDSKIEGRVGALGSVTLTDYSVGSALRANYDRCDLAVAGDLIFTRGSVLNGRVCARGRLVTQDVGLRVQPVNYVVEDLDGYAADADVLSRYLGEMVPDRVVLDHVKGTELKLVGTRTRLNVFQVSAVALAQASGVRIELPYGGSALINVLGSTVALQSIGVTLSGVDAAHVLWNLPQATRLTVASAGVEGSVLATQASLEFNTGKINGSVTVLEASGNGTYTNRPYVGPLHR